VSTALEVATLDIVARWIERRARVAPRRGLAAECIFKRDKINQQGPLIFPRHAHRGARYRPRRHGGTPVGAGELVGGDGLPEVLGRDSIASERTVRSDGFNSTVSYSSQGSRTLTSMQRDVGNHIPAFVEGIGSTEASAWSAELGPTATNVCRSLFEPLSDVSLLLSHGGVPWGDPPPAVSRPNPSPMCVPARKGENEPRPKIFLRYTFWGGMRLWSMRSG
jgi:hypothetical protein